MNIASIALAAVVFCVIAVTLRQSRPEFSTAFSFCGAAFVLLIVINELIPLIDLLNTVTGLSGISEEGVKTVLKAVGICLITQFASDTCRGAGENAVAGAVETAGKIAVMLTAIPLFDDVLKGAMEFIKTG